MALIEEMERSGNWLFRWRSYLPVVLYLMAALVIVFQPDSDVGYFELDQALICLGISLFGQLLRAITIGYTPKGTSGRNTREGQVAEALNTSGIYSTVRHPLYFGNFFMWLGIIVYVGNWWFTLASVLLFWLYYERIMFAEESFLRKKFGQVYLDWAAKTPAFIPRLGLWKNPGWHFSWRNVLKREYSGFFAVFVSFTLIDVLRNVVQAGTPSWNDLVNPFWLWLLVASFLVFIVLRTLKKATRFLNEEGREFNSGKSS